MIVDTDSLYLPDHVLDFTEDKRVLMIGGQGAREEARRKIEKIFGFACVEWLMNEAGGSGALLKAKKLLNGGNVDALFLLTDFIGHHFMALRDECKKLGIPIIYLSGGYSPNRFSKCIEEQACGKVREKNAA